jgi:glutathione S-transferase
MKLFTYATSPYCRKVQMVLDYKGLPYDRTERCFSLDRLPDLLEASPRAEVPALVLDDGRTITDSSIICAYLEEQFPHPPVYPTDPWERARCRMIEELCDTTFDAVGFNYFLAKWARPGVPEARAIEEHAVREMRALLVRLERELGGRPFLCGTFGLADMVAFCHVGGARAMGIDLAADGYPGLAAWTTRVREVPCVQADLRNVAAALEHLKGNLAAEFEGPDGKIHWRSDRLEWPIRHGFLSLIDREFAASKVMFPPEA